jgi:hypothetical protein
MNGENLSLLEEIVLLGLEGARPGKGCTPSELLGAEMRRACGGHKPGVAGALDRLAALGLAVELPRSPRRRAARWGLSAAGQEALRSRLGGASLKGRTWKLKAARIVSVRHALGLEPRAAAALVTSNGLAAYFLAKRLGETYQPGLTTEGLARRSAAAALGLANDQPETLWRGLLQRAVSTAEPGPALPFAEEVRAAALLSREGWFGPRKFFIHRAWQAWRERSGATSSLAEFKARLIEGLQAGEIALSRADFTAEIPQEDLAQSETTYGSESFHFITLERNP